MARRADTPEALDQTWLQTHCDQAWSLWQSLQTQLDETHPGVQLHWLTPGPDSHCEDLILALTCRNDPLLGDKPFWIDFTAGQKAHRQRFGGGKGQPLARAILGKHPSHLPRVLDATAGLANDGYVIAQLGCEVTLMERLPVMAALIDNGLQRVRRLEDVAPDSAEVCQRIRVIEADAAAWMHAHPAAFDVVYLDPMYPHTNKRAAAKKGMQILQRLAGPDQDSDQLLSAALQTATHRVVVKRPKGAPPLAGPAPHAAIKSPNTRYDLYSIQAMTP
ncbi:class I SAM-dependent methyltransferase [Thiomicrospira sp. WB1]|uniref:class I SAM-dependent methyltransferase n=1 Tax=Thiomicrospira sp. WB1 TaxID=1685380 RepID=UPI000747F63B|nr:class I SAM-dependent methyltransferase [Thiomicrospira sp. WB1]KUJ72664.1 16S rRNA methyltransferase [Thiomicrospira sp. WB1]